MKKAATKKKEGASKRGGRKAGSTPSSSKHDDAVVETETPTTQQTQPTQETQEAEEASAKVGSMADSNQEKEDEEAEPGFLTEETQANQEAGEAARAKSPAIEEDPDKKQDDVEAALPDSSSSQQEKEKKPVRRGRPQKIGGARRGGKAASTSSPSKNDDAAAETATQPSQPSQNAEDPVKVESLVIEDKEEAIPDSSSQQGASSSSQPKAEEEKEKEPLRRGKRKRATKEETPPVTKAKRARKTKPQEAAAAAAAEPEYFKEKRSLEDLWKAAFPVGTEWGQLDALYDFEWDFTNVEEAFEEGGKLYGKKVYVFGCTESHLVTYKNENKTILVPAVVCVESSIPPSDKIGITSAESDAEEIIPMKDMKMAWVPYIPLEKRDRKVDRVNFQIFILGCTQRRSALKHLKEDRVKKFNCCLPYINNPFKEDETEQSTVVHINFPSSEPPIVREYDWAIKDIEEFTNDLIVDEALHVDYKDEFNVFVKEQCDKATKAYEEAKQGRDKAKEEMSEETKEAYKEMKLYKFYPLPSPDLSVINKSSFINKYFGTAHEVI